MSYHQSLMEHLKEQGLYSEKLHEEMINFRCSWNAEQEKKDHDEFTWGKYKGRKIEEVFNFDQGYCEWMRKQKYCSSGVKRKIDALLS